VNPQRPSKISQDVFTWDPASRLTQLVVPFEDLVTTEPVFSGGVQVGVQNKFTYVVPLYKAFSPGRTRLAVATLVTSGFFQGQTPILDQLSGTSQVPLLQIYDLTGATPNQLVLVAGRVRTFYTLGGFGVDWHPTDNYVVAPIDVDSPTAGSASPSESSAIFLIEAVPNAIELGKGRQLTHPQGLLQSTNFSTTFALQTDYAPTFSPDGQTIAYLRANNIIDSSGGVTQHRPISIEIRAINFDGSSDRLILQLASGKFTTQLSWSPDGQQIAFDLGDQPTPQPFQLARLEAIPETLSINAVNVNGSNPHTVRSAPAGFPAWQPETVTVTPPRLGLRLTGQPPALVLTWPTLPQSVAVEGSSTLGTADWQTLAGTVTTVNGESSFTVPIASGVRFFRLRIH
jgi:WD40-like Beta Propeller Repeat